MPTIEQTVAFIRKAHEGQTDKAGKPYHLHPEAVAARLGADAPEDDRIIALLHDVIEDTETTAEDLTAMGYSDHVVKTVGMLSRPATEPRPTYMEWVRSIAMSGNLSAIRVKIADNEENSDPVRVAALPPEQQDIVNRYRQSLAILRPALAAATK